MLSGRAVNFKRLLGCTPQCWAAARRIATKSNDQTPQRLILAHRPSSDARRCCTPRPTGRGSSAQLLAMRRTHNSVLCLVCNLTTALKLRAACAALRSGRTPKARHADRQLQAHVIPQIAAQREERPGPKGPYGWCAARRPSSHTPYPALAARPRSRSRPRRAALRTHTESLVLFTPRHFAV
jgi:hypothetical protein